MKNIKFQNSVKMAEKESRIKFMDEEDEDTSSNSSEEEEEFTKPHKGKTSDNQAVK